MKKTLLATTAIAATASAAFAGGIERTTQSTGILYEDGRYFETTLGFGDPSVSGTVGAGTVSSGNIAKSFFNLGFAYKADINETWSYALIYDQPYGAGVSYPSGAAPYPFAGSTADFKSHALTGILEYNMPNNVSMYAGLRAQTIEAEALLDVSTADPLNYEVTGDRDLAFGYLVGVSYEKPEIALRVSLTYLSEINHDLDTSETFSPLAPIPDSTTPITTPQALNLEFQSGIAEDTLAFGSVRWADWTETEIDPQGYQGIFGPDPLVGFADDRITYTLGLGRRLNETWSVLGSVSHERTTGSITGNLAPTDGFTSYALGAVYSKDNMKVTGGLRYVNIGNATSRSVAGDFRDNDAIGAGVKVGWQF